MLRAVTYVSAALVGSAVMLAAVPAVQAQDQKGSNTSADSTAKVAADDPVKLLQLSSELAAYGRANKDALSLINAAKIRQSVTTSKVDRKPEGDTSAKADAAPDFTVDALLEEAKTASGNDEVVVALIEDVKSSKTKGRTAGPGYNVSTLSPGGTHNYGGVNFTGGRTAQVYLEGSGLSDIDLYVYDQNGNLICADQNASDINYCRWTPAWTGPFTLKVVNRAGRSATYALVTN